MEKMYCRSVTFYTGFADTRNYHSYYVSSDFYTQLFQDFNLKEKYNIHHLVGETTDLHKPVGQVVIGLDEHRQPVFAG